MSSTSHGPEATAPWTLAGELVPGSLRRPERRARALSGIPPRRDGQRWWRRLLTSRWTWATLVLLAFYAFCLWNTWRSISADRTTQGQVVPGIDWYTIQHCAGLAAPTALVWSAAFLLFDRFRPMRPLLWLLAFGWGSCAAVGISLVVNTWAAAMMNVTSGAGDSAAQARPAVFSAPFVEEASKASILFLLAILARYRIVSALQSVALAGLSAIGFAFTENIVYYARVMFYGSMTASSGDVDSALRQMVLLRGVVTSYGHPFFTMFTGIGLVVGLRTRSKLVRILAPLVGYCCAALGHMYFNGSSVASGGSEVQLLVQFVLVVGFMLVFLTRQEVKEAKRIRTRLADYVQLGWLPASDPVNMGSQRRRLWLSLVGLRRGPRTYLATLRLMRTLTELAYLRDAMVRGVVDEAGIERERELLEQAAALRGTALDEARGLRMQVPWRRLAFWRTLRERRARRAQLAAANGALLPPGQYPAPGTQPVSGQAGWPVHGAAPMVGAGQHAGSAPRPSGDSARG